ncbi:MAG: bifunctional hydroxymethylpyrimidine kinase/phosphomethylpyrimidine kinase [Candidatus Methanomethylophilaceae archaeon]|nr:bifunctional hydroxymethylpyrimidine kinase/phosphomethylpyrimidine kinase [Candidatus Methanomethylophilaceae archaeon]
MALTIAGSDSVGGAGVQADVKAMAAVGVHAASVITAVTAQNTKGVDAIYPMDPEAVEQQLRTVLRDCDVKAIKTGMLYSADIVDVVCDVLEYHEVPLIVDPVMVSGTGSDLSDDSLLKAMKKKLLPICELVTPNRHEAEALAGMKISNYDDVTMACELIGKEGSSVLLKGGHFTGSKVTDYLYLSSEITELTYPRVQNRSGHGSGCTLSSYITANMASGMDIVNAIMVSRERIQKAIECQYAVGKGDVVVNPFVSLASENKSLKVLNAVEAAAAEIQKMVPHEFVPRKGLNIALASESPIGPEDIAAIDGRMTVVNGDLRKGGPAKFGVAEHLSYVLLEIMKVDPKYRCIMTIAYSDDTMSILEEVGMTAVSVSLNKDHYVDGTQKAIKIAGGIPDAIIDKGPKNNRIIRLIAKDTDDLLNKIEQIL